MPWYIVLFLVLSVVFGVLILAAVYYFIASGENVSETQWEDDEPPAG